MCVKEVIGDEMQHRAVMGRICVDAGGENCWSVEKDGGRRRIDSGRWVMADR